MTLLWPIARPLLRRMGPETAHRVAIGALACGLFPDAPRSDPALEQRLLGLTFENPLGVAAGFDKNAEVPNAMLSLGFGFAEVGTVTPLPQRGNPRPRLFRLSGHEALINRFGFNSEGHDAVYRRLAKRQSRGIVGVNLGANKDSPDRIADYVEGVARFADVADYLAINISSPNTPGLRALQDASDLTRLLRLVVAARDATRTRAPLFVKIAPDLDDEALASVVRTVRLSGVEGLIVSNTTTARQGVEGHRHAREAGGLSGKPLFARSTAMLSRARRLAGRDLVLIGAGGVDSAEAALAKFLAGADLVQLYTGLVYRGPGLAQDIVAKLPDLLRGRGFTTVADAVGAEVDRLPREPAWAQSVRSARRATG